MFRYQKYLFPPTLFFVCICLSPTVAINSNHGLLERCPVQSGTVAEDINERINNTACFHQSLGTFSHLYTKQYPVEDDGTPSKIIILDKKNLTNPTGAELQMQFAEVVVRPGHIREIHWHINSGEWGYVKSGTCRFTLLGEHGRFLNGDANEGDY